jgi:amidophosphoribosyltransferase
LLFDGLTVLQHRGQDAAGMVTAERRRLHLRKDNGLVRDVFRQHHMLELRGNVGIGHCRYPTAGSSSMAEAQPLYTNYPYGICVAHNGNLTNTEEMLKHVTQQQRHVNTDSDSEVLLNLFAEALTKRTANGGEMIDVAATANLDMTEAVFDAITEIMGSCKGGYAGLYLINGVGLVAFRDPHGIRPLVFGCRKFVPNRQEGDLSLMVHDRKMDWTAEMMETAGGKLDYVVASESVAIDTLGFQLVRYVELFLTRLCVCV